MKKRMISVALVLIMALSMTTTVFAANDWESDIDTVGAAVVNNTHYHTVQEAVNNANGSTVKLLAKPTETIEAEDALSLDLNGFEANVNAESLTLVDSGTNDGTEGGKVYGTFDIAQKVVKKDGITYVTLSGSDANGDYYTANAVRVKVVKVSVRPAEESAGMYYTTELKFNKNVVAADPTYGVVLSLEAKPDKDFMEGNKGEAWTVGATPAAGKDFVSTGSNSCLVPNIFKKGLSADDNAERGTKSIYANAYVKIGDTVVMAENANPVVYSMETVMDALNKKFGQLDKGVADNVVKFYKDWTAALDLWTLTNIKNAAK
jgi:hypothetical protein